MPRPITFAPILPNIFCLSSSSSILLCAAQILQTLTIPGHSSHWARATSRTFQPIRHFRSRKLMIKCGIWSHKGSAGRLGSRYCDGVIVIAAFSQWWCFFCWLVELVFSLVQNRLVKWGVVFCYGEKSSLHDYLRLCLLPAVPHRIALHYFP